MSNRITPPLIAADFKIDRHLYWSSGFILTAQYHDDFSAVKDNIKIMAEKYGFDLAKLKGLNKRKALRNCVTPEIGKYILEEIIKD